MFADFGAREQAGENFRSTPARNPSQAAAGRRGEPHALGQRRGRHAGRPRPQRGGARVHADHQEGAAVLLDACSADCITCLGCHYYTHVFCNFS